MKRWRRIAAFLIAVLWVWMCLGTSLKDVKAVGPRTVTVYPGNDEPYEIEVDPGQALNKREVPDPAPQAGAEFVGWYTADGQPYDFNREVVADMLIWAKWRWDSVYINIQGPEGPFSGHDVYADDYRDQAYSSTEYVRVTSSWWLDENGESFTYFEPGKTYRAVVQLETEQSPGGGLHFAFDEDTHVYFNSFYEATLIETNIYDATYYMEFTLEEEAEPTVIDMIDVTVGISETGPGLFDVVEYTDHVWLQDYIPKDENGNLYPTELVPGTTYYIVIWLTPNDEGYIFGPDTKVTINGKVYEPDETPGTHELWVTFRFKYVYRDSVTFTNAAVTDSSGSALSSPAIVDAGETLTVTAVVPAGEAFDHWEVSGITLTEAQLKAETFTFTMPQNEVTIKAVTVKKHAVTLYPYPEQPGTRVILVKDGEALGEIEVEPQDGWKFIGWYEDSTRRIAYDLNTPVTSDLTLYSLWEKEGGEESGKGESSQSGENSQQGESSQTGESSQQGESSQTGENSQAGESSESGENSQQGQSGTDNTGALPGGLRKALVAGSGVAAGGLLAANVVVLIKVLKARKRKFH